MSRMEILTFLKFKDSKSFILLCAGDKKRLVEILGHNKNQVSSKSRGQLYYRL